MNRNQFEINTESRRKYIITYIISHQGCTRADLERGLIKRMSKKTISKLVDIMIAENIIQEAREKQNSRNIKLNVNKSNLLVSVPRELEQFESAFISMFEKANEKIIVPSIFGESSGEEFDSLDANPLERISQLSEERLSLFLRMVDSVLLRSIMEWPKRIRDKDALKKLYQTVFTKISDMLIDIADNHEVPRFCADFSMQKLAIKKLRGGGSLFEYWKKFKNYGMQQEIENVIDSLWKIDKEIQEIVYKDLAYVSTKLGFNFECRLDDWRELFETLSSVDKQKA